jgi:RimJ/RimL family protein N-acetyltransferase
VTAARNAYRIETERLIIRCWELRDISLLQEAIDTSRDHLRPWMPWADAEPEQPRIKIERLRRFKADFDRGADFVYGIFSHDEKRVIGGTGLHTRQGPKTREIGYWIRFDSINQGFATESTAALTRIAFEVNRVPRVEIRCNAENAASAAIPRKLSFILEDITAEDDRETLIWAMHLREYRASRAANAKLRAFDVAGDQLDLRKVP